MSDNIYNIPPLQKQKIKQATKRPLVPKTPNKNSHAKYTYIYEYCNLFEALEYIAYGTPPIYYPDQIIFYVCCSTCNLRQAIEFLALHRIPTDEDGEKFNHYDDRKYLSDAACEQMEKINNATSQLEVLIKNRLVNCILTDKNNASFIAPAPVTIKLTPNVDTGFTLTCNGQDYTNVAFDFDELEKAFKDYSQPQNTYTLTIDTKGLYLQINNREKEQLCRFNYKNGVAPECFNVLQTIMNKPNTKFSSKDFPNTTNFFSLLNKFFAKPKLRGIKNAFFEMNGAQIIFKGISNKLVRIRE